MENLSLICLKPMCIHPSGRPGNRTRILLAKSVVIGCALCSIYPVKRFCFFGIPVVFITGKFFDAAL
jgi:hypothetical protein